MGHAASAGPEPYWEAVKGGTSIPPADFCSNPTAGEGRGSRAALVPPVISLISLSPLLVLQRCDMWFWCRGGPTAAPRPPAAPSASVLLPPTTCTRDSSPCHAAPRWGPGMPQLLAQGRTLPVADGMSPW